MNRPSSSSRLFRLLYLVSLMVLVLSNLSVFTNAQNDEEDLDDDETAQAKLIMAPPEKAIKSEYIVVFANVSDVEAAIQELQSANVNFTKSFPELLMGKIKVAGTAEEQNVTLSRWLKNKKIGVCEEVSSGRSIEGIEFASFFFWKGSICILKCHQRKKLIYYYFLHGFNRIKWSMSPSIKNFHRGDSTASTKRNCRPTVSTITTWTGRVSRRTLLIQEFERRIKNSKVGPNVPFPLSVKKSVTIATVTV